MDEPKDKEEIDLEADLAFLIGLGIVKAKKSPEEIQEDINSELSRSQEPDPD